MPALSKSYGIGVALAAALSSGCLSKTVTHTLYIAPADLTWSAVENEVRSVADDPMTRFLEEQDYLLSARAGRHPIAGAFTALDAVRVDTRIVRGDRPFTVVTEARFGDLASVARALIARTGMRGDAGIERAGCQQTFRAWLDASQEPNPAANEIVDLLGEGSAYRLVLTEGRFVAARGFTIVEDGSVAVPADVDPDEDGLTRVSLTWSDGCGFAPAAGAAPAGNRPHSS